MAINYSRLFARIEAIKDGINEVGTFRGTIASRATTLSSLFDTVTRSLRDGIENAANDAQSSVAGWEQYHSTLAENVLITEVLLDRPFITEDLESCLAELERQMRIDSESLATSGSSTSISDIGTPAGTVTWLSSTLDPSGVASDLVLPDVILARTQTDLTINLVGKSVFDNDAYPPAPGVNTNLTPIDPSNDSITIDPSFSLWDNATTPRSYTVVAGAVARTAESSGFSMGFVGTGSTIRARQLVSVSPRTGYSIYFQAKRSAVSGTPGDLQVDIRDAAGNLLATAGPTVNVGDLTTSFSEHKVCVVTNTFLPDEVYLEIRYSGAVGDNAVIDNLAINDMPTLYDHGLRLAAFGDPVFDDTWEITTTVSGTPTESKYRTLDRLLNIRSFPDIRIPTAGSPSIAD